MVCSTWVSVKISAAITGFGGCAFRASTTHHPEGAITPTLIRNPDFAHIHKINPGQLCTAGAYDQVHFIASTRILSTCSLNAASFLAAVALIAAIVSAAGVPVCDSMNCA